MSTLADNFARLDASDCATREPGLDERERAKRLTWRDAGAEDVRRSPILESDLEDVADFVGRLLRQHGAGALPYVAPIVSRAATFPLSRSRE